LIKICRSCQDPKRPVNRPRGLCWRCYYTPGVQDKFPSTSPLGRRGIGNGNRNAPLPSKPTDALPGSPEKLKVLQERAKRMEALFHPNDAIGVYDPTSEEPSDETVNAIDD
jgi:hypothetical protein